MSKPRQYPSSYQRLKRPAPFRLTERDKAILQSVYQYRLLSASQVEALHFPSTKPRGCRTSCQTRLRKLYDHKYLNRPVQMVVIGEGRKSFLYHLDTLGATVVASLSGLDRAIPVYKPKRKVLGVSFIEHLLAENNFWIVLQLLAKTGHWTIDTWLHDAVLKAPAMYEKLPTLARMGRKATTKIPDGYFCLRPATDPSSQIHFFLEIDMGTMSNQVWQYKVQAYNLFRMNGMSHKHFGTKRFRILTVTTTQARLENLKQATERAKGDSYYWFTTLDQIDIWQPKKLLAPIWQVVTKEGQQRLFS